MPCFQIQKIRLRSQLTKLKEFDPGLAKEFKNLQTNNEGYLKVLISGSVEPIETKIYDALVETIEDYEVQASQEGFKNLIPAQAMCWLY